MFNELTLRGAPMPGAPAPSIMWSYRQAITLKSWSIKRDKDKGTWKLRAEVEKLDAFQARQRPLVFSAPRKKGFWFWPVQQLRIMGDQRVIEATLGLPEQ